ncbi:uncharacterized protein PG986_009415 [Apiospora aurea]|uniref:FAD linked oxidase N-terminal domain-containing protein n=1 Tax=Apiospora aurea TaxID=335848 RepID=A0ABR1Q7L7_9PEZI
MDEFITSLTGKLSTGARILLGPEAPDFKAAMARWSTLDAKVPFAIVQPAEERDILATVQAALQAGTPLVPASSGQSPWSTTVGQEGVVIDLSTYQGDLKHFAQSALKGSSNPTKLSQVQVETVELHTPCKTDLETPFVVENVDVLAVSRPLLLSFLASLELYGHRRIDLHA